MARLSRRGDAALAADGRGQFLLVGAFAIAVFLLVFAGVMNTVGFSESTAARTGEQPAEREVMALQEDLGDGLEGSLAAVNAESDSYGAATDRFEASVGNWSDAVGRQYERDAVGVEVSLQGTVEGSYIAQDTSRTLTNESGARNWTLATGVPDTRRFQLRLDRSSLASGGCDSTACYELVVDDGTDTWTVAVNRSAVVVDGPETTGTCAVQSDPVSVDVTDGTVNGRTCEHLTFAEGLSAPYDLRYRNGANATGTYRLVVNRSAGDIDGSDYGSAPSLSPAIYAASVDLEYRSPGLLYGNVVRVAGGEPDA